MTKKRLSATEQVVSDLDDDGVSPGAIARTLRMRAGEVRRMLHGLGRMLPPAIPIAPPPAEAEAEVEPEEAETPRRGWGGGRQVLDPDDPGLAAEEPQHRGACGAHLADLIRAHQHPAYCPSLAAPDAPWRGFAAAKPLRARGDVTATFFGDPRPGRAWPDGRSASA